MCHKILNEGVADRHYIVIPVPLPYGDLKMECADGVLLKPFHIEVRDDGAYRKAHGCSLYLSVYYPLEHKISSVQADGQQIASS